VKGDLKIWLDNFNTTLDTWIKDLEAYTYEALCRQPSPGSWSVGQMYTHLINDTGFFAEQIRISASTNDYMDEKASANAAAMFVNNDFPDEAIEGSPDNAFIPQPESKEQLTRDLINLKQKMNEAAAILYGSPYKGKSKHPGLGYFRGEEWLQFADMHFRHHFRQKKRIDEFFEIKLKRPDAIMTIGDEQIYTVSEK
jgi:hypothetical protein